MICGRRNCTINHFFLSFFGQRDVSLFLIVGFVIGDRLMLAMGITVRILLPTRGTSPRCGLRIGLAGKSFYLS